MLVPVTSSRAQFASRLAHRPIPQVRYVRGQEERAAPSGGGRRGGGSPRAARRPSPRWRPARTPTSAVAARVTTHRPGLAIAGASRIVRPPAGTYGTYAYVRYVLRTGNVKYDAVDRRHGKETEIATNDSPGRSTLSSRQARQRYVELAELAVLEQIQRDAETLDRESIAVGPFAAPRRERGGGQGWQDPRRRSATCSGARRPSRPRRWRWPSPRATGSSTSSTRHPATTRRPTPGSTPSSRPSRRVVRIAASIPTVVLRLPLGDLAQPVPYGLWSERIRQPSMEEHVQWLDRLEDGPAGRARALRPRHARRARSTISRGPSRASSRASG